MAGMQEGFECLRERMVESQIRSRGITDERIISAFLKVPRHDFIPQQLWDQAYEDHPVPIGEGQTISQPYMVAWMLELLDVKPSDVILEVGSGSGYVAAILSLLAKKVYAVERVQSLVESSRATLRRLGYATVEVVHKDGTLGLPDLAPYDKIIVSAHAEDVPAELVKELKEGGILIIPVGRPGYQELTVVRKETGRITWEERGGCVFVPLRRGVVVLEC